MILRGSKRPWTFGPALLAPALAGLQLFAVSPASASFKYLKPGMEFADFTLKALDDSDVPLAALKEKPATLLVYWATWSPKSEPALREAQALFQEYGDRGLGVVAVNLDRPEPGLPEREKIAQVAKDVGLTVTMAYDPGFSASATLGIVANPSLALLDARGVLAWDASGWSSSVKEALREQVRVALGLAEAKPEQVPRVKLPEHKALLNYNLARTFLRQGNPDKALTLLAAAAEADRGAPAPRTLLAHLLLQRGRDGDVVRAEEHFRAAVALDPTDISALAGLGDTLLASNRVEEAATAFEKAHGLDPAFTPAVAGRASVLARQGRTRDALLLFEAALELNPRDAGIFAARGSCRELAGEIAEAAGDYRRAVEILIGVR